MRERPNLDMIRSLAIGLVLADHFSLALGAPEGGAWAVNWVGVFGVYLFFVHTSLVLMWSLERQPHILNFYIRRAFRIYPLALVALAGAFLLHRTFTSTWGFNLFPAALSWKSVVANALLVQNLLGKPSIVGVMWSLCLEAQMYLTLPMLYFFAVRSKKLWPLLVLWALAAVQGYSLRYSGNFLPTVVPDFLPGVIAFVAFDRFRPVLPAWLFMPFLLGLGAIFMCAPGPAMSWPLALALGLALPLFHQMKAGLLAGFFHQVAKYSYGIYLFHTFLITFVLRWMNFASPAVQIAVQLVGTCVLAVAAYHLVEEPMIRWGSRLARRNDRREALAAQMAAV